MESNIDEISPLRLENETDESEIKLDMVQLRSDSMTKWKILLYGCISWISVFHTTFCVSAIQEEISILLSLSDVEFSLLSTVILSLTAMIAAPFATEIVNRFLDHNIYYGVIFGNGVICISQLLFVIIISMSNTIENRHITVSMCFIARSIAGFGIGINFSCLNALQSIWFSKSKYVSMAAQIMDLSIETGAALAKYTYIGIYNINNEMYQPFLISVGLSIFATLGAIFAEHDEIAFVNDTNSKFNINIGKDEYTQTEDESGNYNLGIVNRLKRLCTCQLRDNLTLLWISIMSFGIAVGFYSTMYSQTEVSFIHKFNLTDFEAEIVLATLPLCKIVTGPLCGWINAKLISYISNKGVKQDEDTHPKTEKYIEQETVKMFAVSCVIGTLLFIACGLIYILSNEQDNNNGINISQPWIFIVCFSFADSIYFGSAYAMIYVLTPTQYTSLFNSIMSMVTYLFIAILSCLFEIMIQFFGYDLAWLLISLLVVISGSLQVIILILIDITQF